MEYLIARKPKVKVILHFLNRLEILVVTNKKCFDFLVNKNNFSSYDSITTAWHDNGRSIVLENENGVPFYVLVFNSHELRVVVHECTHMVHQVCAQKEIPLTLENTETIAYMTDYLVSEVFNILQTKKSKGVTKTTNS